MVLYGKYPNTYYSQTCPYSSKHHSSSHVPNCCTTCAHVSMCAALAQCIVHRRASRLARAMVTKRKSRDEPRGGSRQVCQQAAAALQGAKEKSAVVSLLVSQMLWGFMSAPTVQKLAAACVYDGLEIPELVALASIGTWGAHANNCYRDVQQWMGGGTYHALQSIASTWLVMKRPPLQQWVMQQSVLEPHRIFATMYHQYPNCFKDRVCGGEFANIRRFWTDMETHPLYRNHPIHNNPKHMDFGVPIKLHGDGTPVSGLGKAWLQLCEITSWSSMLTTGASWIYHFMVHLLYVGLIATDSAGVDTRGRLQRRLRWHHMCACLCNHAHMFV